MLEENTKKLRKKAKEDEAAITALNDRITSMEQLLETKAQALAAVFRFSPLFQLCIAYFAGCCTLALYRGSRRATGS